MLASYLPRSLADTPRGCEGAGWRRFALDLRGITVAPLTTMVGLENISCASRYAVLDASRVSASPAVFVTKRQTSSSSGAWFTTLGFSAPHPHVEAVIDRFRAS